MVLSVKTETIHGKVEHPRQVPYSTENIRPDISGDKNDASVYNRDGSLAELSKCDTVERTESAEGLQQQGPPPEQHAQLRYKTPETIIDMFQRGTIVGNGDAPRLADSNSFSSQNTSGERNGPQLAEVGITNNYQSAELHPAATGIQGVEGLHQGTEGRVSPAGAGRSGQQVVVLRSQQDTEPIRNVTLDLKALHSQGQVRDLFIHSRISNICLP